MKFPKLFHGETPGTYDSLFNRARNLLSNIYTWRGADPNADDLSSNDSQQSGPAVGNLNQVENHVDEVPPPIPQAVDIVPLQQPPTNNNNNNNNNNNTPPQRQTPPSTPKSTPNRPPPAPKRRTFHRGQYYSISHISDVDYEIEATHRSDERRADRVRRGEPPKPPLDIQDEEVLNNDAGIIAVNNRVDELTNQNVAIVNNGGDSLEGNTNNNNTNTNNSSTTAANSNNNTSDGEEGLVLPVDMAVSNDDGVLNDSIMLEEEDCLVVEGTANNNNTNNSITNNNISSGEEGLVLNEEMEELNEEMEELKDISNVQEEEDTNTEEEKLLSDIGAVDNVVGISQRLSFGPLSWNSRMDVPPTAYAAQINMGMPRINNTSAAGGGDYGGSSDDSSSEDSESNTAGDVSMGSGNGSDGGGMSVASAGSYTYMDDEDEEMAEDELLNNCMSELDRLSGNVISNIDLNEKSDDVLAEQQNEKSDDASVEGKMFEAAIKASVVGDQAADSVGASSSPNASSSPPSRGETTTTDTEVPSGSIPSSLSSPSSASATAASGSSHEIWSCGRCTFENSIADQTCIECGGTPNSQPVADALPENNLLNGRSVKEFRVEITHDLRCRSSSTNGSIMIQSLGFMQRNPDCAAISLLNAIVHTHSANGSVPNDVFRSITTILGGAVANAARGGRNDGSYLDIRLVQQVVQPLLKDVNTAETSDTNIFDNKSRKAFLSQLVSDKQVAQVIVSNGHDFVLTNGPDGTFVLLDSLCCTNMGLDNAFRITCNTLDDLEVALLSVLSSRIDVVTLRSSAFQALTISSSASTTLLSAQDLTGRISHLVGGTTSQASPGSDVVGVTGKAATEVAKAATSSEDKTDGAIELETEAAAVKASNRVEGEDTVQRGQQSTNPSPAAAKPPRQSTSQKESTSIEESFHHMLKEGIEEVDPSLLKVMIETIEHELDKDDDDTCPHLNEMLRSMVTNMKEHLPDDENDTGIESSDTRNSDTDRNSDEEESSDSDDDDDDDNTAAANDNDNAVDLVYYHPGKENMELISDRYILIFGKEVPKLNGKHITLLSGYNRLKQVCLEHQSEANSFKVKPGENWKGDHAMDVPIKKIHAILVSEGYEFKYIERVTEDKKVVYKYGDPPEPSWGYNENGETNKNGVRANGDYCTYRYMINNTLNNVNNENAIKKAQKSSTQKLEKEYKTIDNDTGIPTLRIIDKDESFKPQYLKPSLGDSPSIEDIRKHVNASDDELAQFQEEKNEALRREKIQKEKKEALEAADDSADNSQAASPCCHTCNGEGCDISLMILREILKHKQFFEEVLAAEDSDSTLSLEDFLSMVRDSKFEFLGTTSENNDIMSQLINLQDEKKKKHGKRKKKICETYKEQWESNRNAYFGNAVYAIVRRLVGECYYCLRKIGKYRSASELGGWHCDHMKKYWKKIVRCSALAAQGKISELLIECIKCRLACGFCHDQHNIEDYDEKLKHISQLSYDFSMNGRVRHRSARESLKLKELRLFILELKMRRAFWTGQNAYMTWDTLEFLVWKYFRVILTDLIHFTRDDWVMGEDTGNVNGKKRRKIVNFAVMNIIKKLGVKCCGCDEDFMNKIPVTMSGIHMDHRGNKNFSPSDTVGMNVDIMIAELKNGNCDPTCIFCHGYVTF